MKSLLMSIPALLAALSFSVLGLAGCSCVGQNPKRDRCDDIRPGSLPDPPGAHLARFEAIQKNNAEAFSYAIFVHEWYMGGKTLGPYGEYHLQQIAQLLPSVPYYVMIQPTLSPELNDIRRAVVVGRLLEAGIADAEVRVRLEYPETEGIFGEEAPRIFRSMLQSNQSNSQGSGAGGTYFPGSTSGNSSGFSGTGIR
jgi:hypothetical protein